MNELNDKTYILFKILAVQKKDNSEHVQYNIILSIYFNQ